MAGLSEKDGRAAARKRAKSLEASPYDEFLGDIERLPCPLTRSADGAPCRPRIPMLGPNNVRGLTEGSTHKFCTCGRAPQQPWCDGQACAGTPFAGGLEWTVPKTQTLWSLCGCKYSASLPLCDGTHTNLTSEIVKLRAAKRRKTQAAGPPSKSADSSGSPTEDSSSSNGPKASPSAS